MISRTSTSWHRVAQGFLTAFVILIPLSATIGPAHLNIQYADLAAVGFLLTAMFSGVWRVHGSRAVWWAAAIYVASLLPSFASTQHLSTSFVEWIKTVYVVCIGFTIARWSMVSSAWDQLVRVFAVVVAALIAFTLAVWGYATWSGHAPASVAVIMAVPNVGQVVRVKGLLLTPTFLANYFTMGVPLLAGYAITHTSWPRVAGWSTLLLGIVATGMTASHSLAGCLAAAALMAPRTTRGDRLARRALMLAAGAAVLFGIVATTISVYEVHASSAPASTAPARAPDHDFLGPHGTGEEGVIRVHYAWVSYGIFKRLALEAWRRHPWIGMGLGEFPTVVVQAFNEGRIHAYYAGGAHPHNTWLGAMAESGLIGLTGLLSFWVVLLWEFVSRGAQRHATSVEAWRWRAPLAGLVGLLINSLHVDVMHFRFLWVGAALLLAATVTTPHRERGRQPSRKGVA